MGVSFNITCLSFNIEFVGFFSRNQEIYRPGTTKSDASNLCTAVGGDQNKKFRGNAFEVKGPKGWSKI